MSRAMRAIGRYGSAVKNVLPAGVQKKLPVMMVPARLKAARFAGDDYGLTDSPDWREVDWSSHLHRIEIFGTSVNYSDIGEEGNDRPILFIHGLGGQWQNWLENIPRFAQTRRVVSVDLPGFGRSDMPAEKITIEFYGRVATSICDTPAAATSIKRSTCSGRWMASSAAT